MHILIPALHRPSKPTGVCRHAVNLAQCLVSNDSISQVTLLIGRWQQVYFDSSFNLDLPKVKLVAVDIKNTSLSRNRWFMFGLPKLARKFQPDLIHMSFPFPFVKQWFKAPVVSTIHDLYPYECPENFGYPQVWFNRLFLSQCIRNSDGLTCVSQVTLTMLKHYFSTALSSNKLMVVYNYVDFSSVTPKPPETELLNLDTEFVLTVAQHRKNKNLNLLIEAYKILLDKNILDANSKLVIVGSSGPETENLLALIKKLALQDRVLLLSSLEDEHLCWLYKFCKLFVIPSSLEGFCLPLVEALSFNSQVVCSDIPIFREVGDAVGCEYFTFEGNAIKNLADKMAIALLRSNPKLSYNCDQRFTKSSVAQRYLNFYESFR